MRCSGVHAWWLGWLLIGSACSSPSNHDSGPGDAAADGDGMASELVDGDLPPKVCDAGTFSCGDGGMLRKCAADGMAWEDDQVCDDGNPCTDDGCAEGACTWAATAKCDDGKECTLDLCLPFSGDCLHEPLAGKTGCCQTDAACDDGHAGTTDKCEVGTGACTNDAGTGAVEELFRFGAKGNGAGQFVTPKGLAVLADGRIVVADSGNNRVLFFTSTGKQVLELTEAFGIPLKAPGCVYETPDSRIFVCDVGNDRMVILTEQGVPDKAWPPVDYAGKLFFSPSDIVMDADLNGFVSDGPGEEFDTGNRLLKFNAKGQVIGDQGKTGIADANFDLPAAVALHPQGTLFVADQGNDRIKVHATSDKMEFVGKFGTNGKEPGQLNAPTDIAIRPDGRIFLADSGNQRVQVFQSCQPSCAGKVCGDDGCGGSCGDCPGFCTCNEQGLCDGWVGEGGDGCTGTIGGGMKGCNGCGCEKCVCEGVDPLDPSLYYDPAAGKDPYCCETEWDEICNGECMFVCGYSCPPGEPPVLPPTFGYVYHWSKAEGKDPLAAPLKVVPLQAGLVYVLDAVKCNVVLYRVFLPTL